MNILLTSLGALAAVAAAGAVQAQVINGNFGAGLAGWNPLGDAIAQANTLTLTTAFNGDDDAPFNLSGNGAAWIDAVEPAAGVATYALDLGGEPAYEGSLAKQTFAVAAGSALSFNWSFSTREATFLDNAFVVINGAVTSLANRTAAPVGQQTFSRSFAQAANVTLVFGVVDTGDLNGVSTLNIRNVQVSAVPEPATLGLWLAGVAGVGAAARRRRPATR